VFAAVQAPPLLLAQQVQIIAGQSPVEQRRMERAHKHHGQRTTNMTRDDTLDGVVVKRRYGSDVRSARGRQQNIPR
jgi:hypothetical protein